MTIPEQLLEMLKALKSKHVEPGEPARRIFVEDLEREIDHAALELTDRPLGMIVVCPEHGEGLRVVYLSESWEAVLVCPKCKRQLARLQMRSRGMGEGRQPHS
jgi:uncharacterized protein YbaR (Trm112 family)